MNSTFVDLSFLFSASALIIVILSILLFKSYLKRRTSHERILAELREEVNSILRSINETTERDILLIEGRENDLKKLLVEIDRRLKIYSREMELTKKAEIVRTALSESAASADGTVNQQTSYQDLGKNRYRIKKQLAEEAAEEGPAFPLPEFDLKSETNPPDKALPMGEQIRSLLRSGFSPQLIASRLGVSIAEVEFAAALLERRDDGQ